MTIISTNRTQPKLPKEDLPSKGLITTNAVKPRGWDQDEGPFRHAVSMGDLRRLKAEKAAQSIVAVKAKKKRGRKKKGT